MTDLLIYKRLSDLKYIRNQMVLETTQIWRLKIIQLENKDPHADESTTKSWIKNLAGGLSNFKFIIFTPIGNYAFENYIYFTHQVQKKRSVPVNRTSNICNCSTILQIWKERIDYSKGNNLPYGIFTKA